MALPALDATFASSADLPRKQMLAKWLVEELGETQAPSSVLVSGSGSAFCDGVYTQDGEQGGRPRYVKSGGGTINWGGDRWLIDGNDEDVDYEGVEDTEFPWSVTSWSVGNGESPAPTVTEIPQPSPLSNYYSLPERYLWAKIAVAAGAPKPEADYISLPKNYAWSDIYNAVAGLIPPSNVLVSGAGSSAVNGTYTYRGEEGGKPYYNLVGEPDEPIELAVSWIDNVWAITNDGSDKFYTSSNDVQFPWQVTSWVALEGSSPVPIVTEIPQQTPNHTDWSENVALGHIAAAYRGDTANPANLATYIDWPWRYKIASIILAL